MASKHDATTATWSSTTQHMPETNEKLQKRQPKETGKQIKYDIQELRRDPQKIARWAKQREELPEFQPQETATQMWKKLKQYIQQGITQSYPLKKEEEKNCRNGQKKHNNGVRRKNGKSSNNNYQTEKQNKNKY